MNRQSVSKTQKPNSLTLIPATDILQRKLINRTDFGGSSVDKWSPLGEQIDKPSLSNAESNFSHDFSKIPIRLSSRNRIQAKLKIGQPNDKYEQEADRIADLVMQTSEHELVAAPAPASAATHRHSCARCSVEEKAVRRSALQPTSVRNADGLMVSNAMQSGIESLQNRGGSTLLERTRGFMEQRFGHDFSKVRIFTDARAGELAGGLGARAFTVGSDLVFAPGEYRPHTKEGMRLLAHELTHVLRHSETGRIHRQRCAYGEIRSWAIVSQSDFTSPAGLSGSVASLEASCARGQRCSCIDGSGAIAPGDQAAWRNINAASGGADQSGGGEYMCVGHQNCRIVQRCAQCNGNQRQLVNRATPLAPVGQTTVTGKGTLYFYTDPFQGWCNATDRRTACQPPQS